MPRMVAGTHKGRPYDDFNYDIHIIVDSRLSRERRVDCQNDGCVPHPICFTGLCGFPASNSNYGIESLQALLLKGLILSVAGGIETDWEQSLTK